MRFALPKLFALISMTMVLLIAAVPSVSAQSGGWQPGPGAILDNTYDGFIDTPQNGATVPGAGSFNVMGWFVDKQAQGWAGADDVQVWLGTMDGGGHMLAKAAIAQNRPDVGAATGNPYFSQSGFNAVVPGSSVPAGSQTLNVYAHTGGKGWWFKPVTVMGGGSGSGTAAAPSAPAAAASNPNGAAPVVKFINPQPAENVSTKSDYVINGTVDRPSEIDRIEVWINGERDSQYASLLGTTTPSSDGSWSVTFKPTRFPSTHSNLYAYAHSSVTGKETEAITDINIVDK
jgi:Bacterial Ig domain